MEVFMKKLIGYRKYKIIEEYTINFVDEDGESFWLDIPIDTKIEFFDLRFFENTRAVTSFKSFFNSIFAENNHTCFLKIYKDNILIAKFYCLQKKDENYLRYEIYLEIFDRQLYEEFKFYFKLLK
jgi:hypothetical protein